jgi:GGDEF domain-containing protein
MIAENGGTPPVLPAMDPLDDATVLVAGRGPLYAALGVAMGQQVKMIGALSVEAAAKHLGTRDIHGIVIGDGFPGHIVESFLDALANEPHFRDFPLAVAGADLRDYRDKLINLEYVEGDASKIVGRVVPMLRLRALDMRLTRMLASLDADGSIDPETGLLSRNTFMHGLAKAVAEAADRSQALSIARYAFEGAADERAVLDAARLLTRLTRPVDFACRDEDGSILVTFTETDLREAHMIARRLAADLKAVMKPGAVTANVTLATLKAGDTVDSLMQRVLGSRMVAAE